MLSTKQKIAKFKQRSKENYLASLSLEGVVVKNNTSSKNINELKAKYAR
ncbi:MAG: hypothetical protein COB38_01655 [Gammaproteobacteria bacterium]|nr:MAG: hypothetical protein COB38_01655 [Gammaproteobacteria bacterium]